MSLFGNLKSDNLEQAQDRLGGYRPFDTDIYTGIIKMAYAGQSQGGAHNVTLIVDVGGRDYRETIYVTNKKGENWFFNKDDKSKKVPLPGFTVLDDICLVTTDKPLSEQEPEDKVVKVYDPEAKKEMPKSVPVLTELLGKQVSLGIVQSLENKNERDAAGNYTPTAETRTVNTIEKVFHTESKMTVAEIRNGIENPTFWGAWQERNKGQVRDKRTIKDGAAGQSGRPGAKTPPGPPVATATAAPRRSLFGARA